VSDSEILTPAPLKDAHTMHEVRQNVSQEHIEAIPVPLALKRLPDERLLQGLLRDPRTSMDLMRDGAFLPPG
jgi:hypothetical protein